MTILTIKEIGSYIYYDYFEFLSTFQYLLYHSLSESLSSSCNDYDLIIFKRMSSLFIEYEKIEN
jgi:hypothetical protein